MLSAICLCLALTALPTQPAQPMRLVFSIDQGFGNGIVVNRDTAAMRRIAEALQTLRPQYQVYALFEPQVRNRANLDAILEVCVAADLPVVFDVYSSDALTLGTSTAQNAPADGPHGIAISPEDLARYRQRLGTRLAGLRIMEVFSFDFTLHAIRTTNPEWKGKGWLLPADDFWQPALARPFLEFARRHTMFVQFSDWHWLQFAPWDQRQPAREEGLRQLLNAFPDTVTLTYANNEPDDKSVPRLKNWHLGLQPFLRNGAAGIGLSDQSWMRKDETRCPPEEIVAWAERALELNCRLIQFEPVWYFFKLPRGSFGLNDYTKDDVWKNAGTPTDAFEALRRTLKPPPTPRSADETRPDVSGERP